MSGGRHDRSPLDPVDVFAERHLGPREGDLPAMLDVLGVDSLEALIDRAVPESLRHDGPLRLEPPRTERALLEHLRELASANRVWRSFIGMGYHDTVTPPAIQRHILENPGWYTAYTPYQPEISQGRLEALLNFQTLVADLTGLPVANASLLDEATAAAEAMTLCRRVLGRKGPGDVFLVSDGVHPQTLAVVRTRAEPLGIRIRTGDVDRDDLDGVFGALVQYPTTDGRILDYAPLCRRAAARGALVVAAADPLALTLLRPPGEFGADVAVGSMQRFGVPLGYGGPHAAYLATREAFARQVPGRIVGISRDACGRPALRLALQTREQHIRRGKATSNICTAQVLLAVMAQAYAVYHGPEGLVAIARRIHRFAETLARLLVELGHTVHEGPRFDTLRVTPAPGTREAIAERLEAARINLRRYADGDFGIALGQTVSRRDLIDLYEAFGGRPGSVDRAAIEARARDVEIAFAAPHARTTSFLDHEVFHRYRSETELMRYLHRLRARDLSLDTAMIPLGSCTMKLNAATEMLPITWPEFAALHPFAPSEQAAGYRELFRRLERWLAEITGFDAVSLQPNAGAQGEYAGLLVIRAWHAARGEGHRDVCLIPESAHGTNPASAVMAGMNVVVVGCDADGNIDAADLEAKSRAHGDRLAALMVTYPSTHGVFEESIRRLCRIVHDAGGQVYLDGANMNAMVGLCRPADFGADVCHLNLHKTFCIPHGGGGPGVGPIAVAAHLAEFLPGHPVVEVGGERAVGTIAAAPWGSAGILPISYAYIALMGANGLRRATETAILNANYVSRRLARHYRTLYTGARGYVAHECVLDLRPFRASAGVDVEDVAKRLIDYGFHAPTMSWPVAGTLMVEPTESESREELDRFCEAMIRIREEIRRIETGALDPTDNMLKNAPHTAEMVAAEDWPHPYSRQEAAFPAPWSRERKFWPPVARVDNAWGDRHLAFVCPATTADAAP